MFKFSAKQFGFVVMPMAMVSCLPAVAAMPWWESIGWHKSATPSYCGGHFNSIEQQAGYKIPLPGSKDTSISSSGLADLASNGDSILHGHVVLKQPGRIVLADKAIISRNAKLGKVEKVRLYGHVFIFTPTRMATAPYAVLWPRTNKLAVRNVVYRIDGGRTKLTAWGKGTQLHGESAGVWNVSPATYTTCAPNNPEWMLHTKHLHVNEKTKRAKAHHVWLKFHKVPVFYFPYLSFSLDKSRKTGFLAPAYEHSSGSGAGMLLPFYWNMAPNYDMTLNSYYYLKRHFRENMVFRHLNTWGQGKDIFTILPDDTEFARFKRNTRSSQAGVAAAAPYLRQLNAASATRWQVNMHEQAQWDKRWQANLDVNHVSDPYLLQDFSFNSSLVTANQLFNRASIAYAGDNLQADALAQGFQTLHPINSGATDDQYTRLPQFDIAGEHDFGPVNASAAAQWVDFGFSDFSGSNGSKYIGSRLHLRPALSLPIVKSWGYITPRVQEDIVDYSAHTLNHAQTADVARGMPMFDVDTGLYLQRRLHWHQHAYQQFVTPRLYYLYVPYQDQNTLPNFASDLLPFSYQQLFNDNRYTDFDRIQNANQLSFGVQTKILNSAGDTKLTFGTGIASYFTKPRVSLPVNTGLTEFRPSHWSPWTSTLSYYFSKQLYASLYYNQNTSPWRVNSAGTDLTYLFNNDHVLYGGYDFVRNYNTTNYDSFHLGYMWPVNEHWSGFGYLYYDLAERHANQYYVGAQYDNCCWALRIMYNSTYLGSGGLIGANRYNHTVLFQIAFKGLSGVGSDGMYSALSLLPGERTKLGDIR